MGFDWSETATSSRLRWVTARFGSKCARHRGQRRSDSAQNLFACCSSFFLTHTRNSLLISFSLQSFAESAKEYLYEKRMSLLGSEVDISDGCDEELNSMGYSPETLHPPLSPLRSLEEDLYDAHPPVTPPRPAEALFFNDLPTQTISAAALAQQIHQRHRPLSIAGTSIATDDFVSASAEHLDTQSAFSLDSPFGKDALAYSRETIAEEDTLSVEERFQDSNMSSTSEDMHVDAADKVYQGAKGVWAWGKGIIVFKPFLGIAEGVAGKVVGMAGSSMDEVDGCMTHNLHGLDDNVLNPAIKAVVQTVMGAVGKTEEIFKPLFLTVLKPLGLVKEDGEPVSAPTPAQSTKTIDGANPEVTYAKAAAVS